MDFIEFLQTADRSSLSGLSLFDVIFASGLSGLASIFLGLVTVAVGAAGLLVRPLRFAPLALGLLALLVAFSGAYSGYRHVDAAVNASEGWEKAEAAEISDGATFCMTALLIGVWAFCMGLGFTLVDLVVWKVRAKVATDPDV